MAELALGTHIGGWVNRGVVFVLTEKNGNTLSGYMQIVQGGDPDYGQKTDVTVTVDAGGNWIVGRNIGGNRRQLGNLNVFIDVDLGGTAYFEGSGPTEGPGADGGVGQIRVLR